MLGVSGEIVPPSAGASQCAALPLRISDLFREPVAEVAAKERKDRKEGEIARFFVFFALFRGKAGLL
jgi:hypothetical protein